MNFEEPSSFIQNKIDNIDILISTAIAISEDGMSENDCDVGMADFNKTYTSPEITRIASGGIRIHTRRYIELVIIACHTLHFELILLKLNGVNNILKKSKNDIVY